MGITILSGIEITSEARTTPLGFQSNSACFRSGGKASVSFVGSGNYATAVLILPSKSLVRIYEVLPPVRVSGLHAGRNSVSTRHH